PESHALCGPPARFLGQRRAVRLLPSRRDRRGVRGRRDHGRTAPASCSRVIRPSRARGLSRPQGLDESAVALSSREMAIERLAEREFDLLVIGGGIVGAGIGAEAARNGLAVALVERGDFGGGTSTASSKLIHGG